MLVIILVFVIIMFRARRCVVVVVVSSHCRIKCVSSCGHLEASMDVLLASAMSCACDHPVALNGSMFLL